MSLASSRVVCLASVIMSSLLAVPSFALGANQAPRIGRIDVEISEPNCTSQSAQWVQISGPAIGNVPDPGATSSLAITHPGNYEFELSCCAFDRRNSLLQSPDRIGFGAATTGGAAAKEFTVVTSLLDSGPGSLREALEKPGPLYIIFDPSIYNQTIRIASAINVKESDITIDGRGSNIVIQQANHDKFAMLVFRGGNTILAGFTIDGNGGSGTGLMPREGRNYWLDHLTITNFAHDDALSVGQGGRPDTSASEVTISNYKAYNTSKGFQAGGNDKYPDFPLHRTTIFNSYLGGEDRNPRIQYGGQTHVYNSYINSFVYAGMDAGRTAQIISENNVFDASNALDPNNAQTGRPPNADLTGVVAPTGHVYSSGDLFMPQAGRRGSINPTSPKAFAIPYDYNLRPADEVVDYVMSHAGAEFSDDNFGSCTTYSKRFVISAEAN